MNDSSSFRCATYGKLAVHVGMGTARFVVIRGGGGGGGGGVPLVVTVNCTGANGSLTTIADGVAVDDGDTTPCVAAAIVAVPGEVG